MSLQLHVHVVGAGSLTTDHVYDEVEIVTPDVEIGRDLTDEGAVEAGVVDLDVLAPTFLGAAGRRQLPDGPHRARLIDARDGGDVVLADGLVRVAEVGHDDPGDDPDAPLCVWSVRVADRARQSLVEVLEDQRLGTAAAARLRDGGHARRIALDVRGESGSVTTEHVLWWDLSALARGAVEDADATVAAWPDRLATLGVTTVDGQGQAQAVQRGGTVYVCQLQGSIADDDLSTLPRWTGAEALAAASAFRGLGLRASYVGYPGHDVAAALVAPSDPAGAPVLDGVVLEGYAEAGQLASSPALSVGFGAPDLEAVPPAGAYERPATWLRSAVAGDTSSLGVRAELHFCAVREDRTVPAAAGDHDVAVGRPLVYFGVEGVLVCVVDDAAPAEAVAYRAVGAGRRHELAASTWIAAYSERASDLDTVSLTVDLDDAAEAGLDLSGLDAGDVAAWDGDVWTVERRTLRHDDGQLDLDLRRPRRIARGRLPSEPRTVGPPQLTAAIEKAGDPAENRFVAVARPRPGAGADAPDRYEIEVRGGEAPPYDWASSTGVEDVDGAADHREYRARSVYEAEGHVSGWTGATTDPGA